MQRQPYVHKKMLAVVVSDVEKYQFQWRMTPQYWKPVWEVKGIGSQYERSEKAQGGDSARCIWRRRYPIAGDGDERRISAMPNAW